MSIPPDTFRTALSRWSSGVTIVTARTPEGERVGLTASSFASLSLEPPLVLFCLGRASTNFDAFQAVPGFAVHILGAEQEALSNRFAAHTGDRFEGLELSDGRHGAPLLPGCLAVLECRLHQRVPGGDHVIMMGEVEEVTVQDGAPLVYFRGSYRRLSNDA